MQIESAVAFSLVLSLALRANILDVPQYISNQVILRIKGKTHREKLCVTQGLGVQEVAPWKLFGRVRFGCFKVRAAINLNHRR